MLHAVQECRTCHPLMRDLTLVNPCLFAGIVLTNDGHAILREIDVTHPAAKVERSGGLATSHA